MTLFQMYEECKEHFPNIGITQFTKDLNKVYKHFAHETRLLVKQANLTIVANTVEYTLATAFTDIDGELVKEILFKDIDGEFVSEHSVLTFRITNGKIRFYTYKGESMSEISTDDISTITFVYVYVPTELSTDAGSPVLDTQFHDALLYGVLEKYYATYPSVQRQFQDGSVAQTRDLQTASYFKVKYKELELAGKKKANEYTPMHTQSYGKGF